MAGMHDRLRAMVIRQLSTKKQGVPITFQQIIPGIYDPVTGGVSPAVTNTYNGSGVRVNYSEYAYKNTSIEAGDFQIYLSPVQVDGNEMPRPTAGDEFMFIDKIVRVINVQPFNDNAANCGWKLQVRYG